MNQIATEVLLILVLIVANGVFALAEVSIVASRKARLQQRAREGDAKAAIALELAESPNRFLATVQIGITLVGIFAGAFGGATLSKKLAEMARTVPVLEPYADSIGLGLVVLAITYLSLIVGELVPKRIGLHSPEKIASFVAGPMRLISTIASPFVSFLGFSTDMVLRLIGMKASDEPVVTEEEINVMMEQGREAGVFAEAEQDMVQRIFRLGDRTVSSLMTRRHDIMWLDINDSWKINRDKLTASVYSRMPVCNEELDKVLGVLRAKNLLDICMEGQQPELTPLLQKPVFVPETLPAFKLMETFKTHRTHFIFVVDEHGTIEGLVTLHDILTAIVGDLPGVDESDESYAMQREDGSWLLDGMMPIDEFKNLLAISSLPGEGSGNFQTLGGFIMMQMGRIPAAAEFFELDGWRYEVMDMDGHRIDKVLVRASLDL
jgi:putative hemolysin